MAAKITINTDDYYLKEGTKIKWSYVQQFQDLIRQREGVLTRQDNQVISRLRYRWNNGVGWARQDRETGRGTNGLRDSTWNTLHRVASYGILHESQTHATPADHLIAYVPFADTTAQLFGLFEEDYDSGAITNLVAREFGATSDDWTSGGTITTPGSNVIGQRIYAGTVHKTVMFAAHTGIAEDTAGSPEEDEVEVSSSSDGATWATASGTGFSHEKVMDAAQDSRSNNLFVGNWLTRNHVDLLDTGDELLLAHHSRDSTAIVIQKTTDSGSNWSTVVSVTPNSRNVHLVMWRDLDDLASQVPVLVTGFNAYKIDTSAGTATRMFPDGLFSGFDADAAAVGLDGNLYVSLRGGGILCFRITGINSVDILDVGPPGDGLVSSRQGSAWHMLAVPGPWLIVSYGGAEAGENAGIWAIEYQPRQDPETGKEYRVWHSLYKESDANLIITQMAYSTVDDGIPRLHFAIEGADTTEMYHLENPFANPSSGVTQKYQASSTMEFAEDDMGDPHNDATVHEARIEADNLSADDTGEYVEYKYGVNGGSWSATDQGDFLSGDLDLVHGSGAGVSAKTLRNSLVGHRDAADTTDTVLLKDFEVAATKTQQVLRSLLLTIDLDETARSAPTGANTTPETIIANLEAIMKSETKVACSIGGLATMRVRVRQPAQWELEAHEQGGGDGRSTGILHGLASVVIEEVLEGSPTA